MRDAGATRVVAVGVDGTGEALEAARYAAAVARDRGWDLMVVHGPVLRAGSAGYPAPVLVGCRSDAEMLVDAVVDGLQLGPRTVVSRVISPSGPVAALLGVAAEVSLLVLGRHHFNLADQLLTGRVAPAVAARAPCPVVVVPQGWSRHRGTGGPVVVALDGETRAEPALRLAFEEAERRRSAVVGLHAVPLRADGSSLRLEQAWLAELLAGARQDHPDVPVRTVLVPGDPAERIIEGSIRAELMVVGRPHRGHRLGSWSRSVARAVLDRSFCPLVVAPPVGRGERVEARAGALAQPRR
jgi:nucleotide-binding universal stress UspA family protein